MEGDIRHSRLEALKWYLQKKQPTHYEEFKKFNIWTKCNLNTGLICKWITAFNKKGLSPKSIEQKKRKFGDGKVERGNYF